MDNNFHIFFVLLFEYKLDEISKNKSDHFAAARNADGGGRSCRLWSNAIERNEWNKTRRRGKHFSCVLDPAVYLCGTLRPSSASDMDGIRISRRLFISIPAAGPFRTSCLCSSKSSAPKYLSTKCETIIIPIVRMGFNGFRCGCLPMRRLMNYWFTSLCFQFTFSILIPFLFSLFFFFFEFGVAGGGAVR